jgi:acid phosphatase family membrane protein YuiD
MDNLAIVFIPVIVAIITQITKFAIFSAKNGIKWEYFFTHGHMPSTHSAFAISLVIIVGYLETVLTAPFAIAVALAVIIIDDALRLRMYLGDQGRYLNMLVENLNLDPEKYPRLKERVGHRTSEVIVGIIFGTLFSFLFIYLFR